MLISCHTATFLMSQGRERPLTAYERRKLKLHNALCRGCDQFEVQIADLAAAARALAAAPPREAGKSDGAL